MLQAVIDKISEQQKTCEGKPAWCVGEHLKDILRDNPDCSEIVLKDLEVNEMSIIECEKKIKAYADKQEKARKASEVKPTKEGFSFIPPKEAERIIKEFYGISSDGSSGQATGLIVDLFNFM